MTFKQWILQYVDDQIYYSEFAHDVRTDRTFPNTSYYREMYEYLTIQGASHRVLNIFEKVWNEYIYNVSN